MCTEVENEVNILGSLDFGGYYFLSRQSIEVSKGILAIMKSTKVERCNGRSIMFLRTDNLVDLTFLKFENY